MREAHGILCQKSKKAECQRIDAFKLCCWRRLLRVPWTARKWNQSILKKSTLNIHWMDCAEAETPMLCPPDVKRWLTGKTLMLGMIEGRRRSGRQRRRCLDGITDFTDISLSKFWEIVKDREAWHATVQGVTKSQIWLRDWTTPPKIKKWKLPQTNLSLAIIHV